MVLGKGMTVKTSWRSIEQLSLIKNNWIKAKWREPGGLCSPSGIEAGVLMGLVVIFYSKSAIFSLVSHQSRTQGACPTFAEKMGARVAVDSVGFGGKINSDGVLIHT